MSGLVPSQATPRSVGLVGGALQGTSITNGLVYLPCDNLEAGTSSEITVQTIWPVAGTITKMFCRVEVAVTAGHTLTCTLRKNGVATALVATITNADGTDVVSATGSIAVAAGDLLSVSYQKDAVGAQTLDPKHAFVFTPS